MTPSAAATSVAPALPTAAPTAAWPAALHDRARLQAVLRLGLDRPAGRAALHAAAREAAQALALPIGLVNVVLDDAVGARGAHGVSGWLAEAGGVPAEWAPCRFVVADRAPVLVEDMTTDPRTAANPLVALDGLRCYAGVPLLAACGAVVGTLCVLGTAPRRFHPADVAALEALAAAAVRHLEAAAA